MREDKAGSLALIDDIARFYHENIGTVFFTVVAALACFGRRIFSLNIGTDTEIAIYHGPINEWDMYATGRFGQPVSYFLTNFGKFDPYVNGLFSFVFFTAAILLWMYVFHLASGGKSRAFILFALIFISHPLWPTQFYFEIQQSRMSVGLFSQALSFMLLLLLMRRGSRLLGWQQAGIFLLSLLLAYFPHSLYQAFTPFMLSEAAALILLMYDDTSYIKNLKNIGIFAAHFLISFLAYEMTLKVMGWGTDDYLATNWGVVPVRNIVVDILRDIKHILLGEEYYAGYAVLISGCIMAYLVLKRLFGKEAALLKAEYAVIVAGNFLCLAALDVVEGGIPVDRARVSMIFGCAFLAMYSFDELTAHMGKEKLLRAVRLIAGIGFALSVILQTSRTLTLYYTDDVCSSQQYLVGNDIVRNIDKVGGEWNATAVVLGAWYAPLNEACITQPPIGWSNFSFTYNDSSPASGSRRSVEYIDAAFGKHYNGWSTEEEQALAIEAGRAMPSYPNDGYVANIDGMLVIKLSEY